MANLPVYLKDYTPSNFLVEKIHLEFDLHDDYTTVTNTAIFYKNTVSDGNNTLTLDGEDVELLSIKIDGVLLQKSSYSIEGYVLTIEEVPKRFELEVVTKIEPQNNTQLMGLYKTKGMFCTQCESQGFRRITYYLDRPDVLTLFTVKIIGDKELYPLMLSNGNNIESGILKDNRHYVVWQDPFPKPCYLFALVAGNLEYIEDTFATMSGKEVVIRIFTESHNIHKCSFAMESVKKSMKWDEETFGREYDLEIFMIVVVDDFNSGGMENKGLNIFNSACALATKDTATDADFIRVETVIGHEYFHNWTGDRVTCRDWFQLSLKEGLTVYRDHEFTADMHDRSVKRIESVKLLRAHQFKEDGGPMAHPIRPDSYEEISNFYTSTVYEKGSEVVRIYEQILGKQGFRAGMDLYFERHDGKAVTTEDFLKAMSDANCNNYQYKLKERVTTQGVQLLSQERVIDLSQMQNWYEQAGTPKVEVVSDYNDKEKTYTVFFRQTCPDTPESNNKKPFLIPIRLGLIDELTGDEMFSGLIILDDYKHRVIFENVPEKPVISLLRGFSAPVKIEYAYSDQSLVFLAKHDTDDFNKYEAFQKYVRQVILEDYEKRCKKLDSKLKSKKLFIELFVHILSDKVLSNSLKGEILVIPSLSELEEYIPEHRNHDILFEVRESLIQELSTSLVDTLEKKYIDLVDKTLGEYVITNKQVGNRKLKNLVLFYLTIGKNDNKIAYAQFKAATNMTEEMGAFKSVVTIHNDIKEKALSEFYTKWKADDNVIDKWFSIQSQSTHESVFEAIEILKKDELFSIKNPNKVRSIFSAFANLNPYHLNHSSGKGYNLIADTVIELNAINPMVASRLLKSIINWKYLEPKRKALLKAQLERIHSSSNLSPDVAEVIKKSLEK